MIAGSFASNIHGLPRATQDADVVIEVEEKILERFLNQLRFSVLLELTSSHGRPCQGADV